MVSAAAGTTAYVQADLREPEAILADPALGATLDLSRPVGLLLVAVLHFLHDADAYRSVDRLVGAMPPGSYLVLSHATFDPVPADTIGRLTALAAPGAGHGTFRPRTRDEVARFLGGLDLVHSGLVPIVEWRPEQEPQPLASVEETAVYAAVARLP